MSRGASSRGFRVLERVSRASMTRQRLVPFRYLVSPPLEPDTSSGPFVAFMKTKLRSSVTGGSLQSGSRRTRLKSLAGDALPGPPSLSRLGANRRSIVTYIFASSPVPCNRTSLMRSRHATFSLSRNGVTVPALAPSSRPALTFTAPPAHMRRTHGLPGKWNGSVPSSRSSAD